MKNKQGKEGRWKTNREKKEDKYDWERRKMKNKQGREEGLKKTRKRSKMKK